MEAKFLDAIKEADFKQLEDVISSAFPCFQKIEGDQLSNSNSNLNSNTPVDKTREEYSKQLFPLEILLISAYSHLRVQAGRRFRGRGANQNEDVRKEVNFWLPFIDLLLQGNFKEKELLNNNNNNNANDISEDIQKKDILKGKKEAEFSALLLCSRWCEETKLVSLHQYLLEKFWETLLLLKNNYGGDLISDEEISEKFAALLQFSIPSNQLPVIQFIFDSFEKNFKLKSELLSDHPIIHRV